MHVLSQPLGSCALFFDSLSAMIYILCVRYVVVLARYQRIVANSEMTTASNCSRLPCVGSAYACQPGVLSDEAIALFKKFYCRENTKGDGDDFCPASCEMSAFSVSTEGVYIFLHDAGVVLGLESLNFCWPHGLWLTSCRHRCLVPRVMTLSVKYPALLSLPSVVYVMIFQLPI